MLELRFHCGVPHSPSDSSSPVLNKTRSTANGELNYFDVDMGVSMMRKSVGKLIETLMRGSAIELPIGFH